MWLSLMMFEDVTELLFHTMNTVPSGMPAKPNGLQQARCVTVFIRYVTEALQILPSCSQHPPPDVRDGLALGRGFAA